MHFFNIEVPQTAKLLKNPQNLQCSFTKDIFLASIMRLSARSQNQIPFQLEIFQGRVLSNLTVL